MWAVGGQGLYQAQVCTPTWSGSLSMDTERYKLGGMMTGPLRTCSLATPKCWATSRAVLCVAVAVRPRKQHTPRCSRSTCAGGAVRTSVPPPPPACSPVPGPGSPCRCAGSRAGSCGTTERDSGLRRCRQRPLEAAGRGKQDLLPQPQPAPRATASVRAPGLPEPENKIKTATQGPVRSPYQSSPLRLLTFCRAEFRCFLFMPECTQAAFSPGGRPDTCKYRSTACRRLLSPGPSPNASPSCSA